MDLSGRFSLQMHCLVKVKKLKGQGKVLVVWQCQTPATRKKPVMFHIAC